MSVQSRGVKQSNPFVNRIAVKGNTIRFKGFKLIQLGRFSQLKPKSKRDGLA